MKILHTADWHIGKKLEHFSRIEEQRDVLNEICKIANDKQVDAIIIAGDLFDNFNPSTEAIELFYSILKRLTNEGSRPVIAISGNHDSPDRIETVDPLAKACGIIFLGYPNSHTTPFQLESGLKISKTHPGFIEISIPNAECPLRIITTPYANEHRLKKSLNIEDKEDDLRRVLESNWKKIALKHCDNKGVNILATHLFVINKGSNPPEEPDDEKPILHVGGAQAIYTENFPSEIQYVALGHLHKKQIIESNKNLVAYSGSPLPYSFAESNQEKFVLIIDVSTNKSATIEEIQLKQGKKLKRIFAQGLDDALNKLSIHINDLIELTLETDTYITAEERKVLHQAHKGIITLIPQVKRDDLETSPNNQINLNKGIKELFADYFKHTNGIEPNSNILDLLNEVISEKDTEA